MTDRENDDDTRRVFADYLDEQGEYDEANRMRAWPEAKAWLVAFAAKCTYTEWHQDETPRYTDHVMSFSDVIDTATGYVDNHSGRYGYSQGSWFPDNEPDNMDLLDDENVKAEFWKAWSVITGKQPLLLARNNPFVCCY